MKPAMLRFSSGILFLLTGVAFAQTARQTASKPQPPEKLTFTECEGGDNCGTWIFLWVNGKGTGKWRTGEEAVLELDAPAENKVVILRTDVSGAKEGLTARYEGVLSNGQLGGTVEYTYKGQRVPGFWNAAVAAPTSGPSSTLPPEMHFRAQHSVTFVLRNGQYINCSTIQGQRPGQMRVLTVEKFTPELIILHRTDYGDYPGTAVYSGKPGDNGNSLTGNGWKLTWGPALNDLPASDPEIDGVGTCQQRQTASLGINIDGSRIVNDLITWGIEEFIKGRFRGGQQ